MGIVTITCIDIVIRELTLEHPWTHQPKVVIVRRSLDPKTLKLSNSEL